MLIFYGSAAGRGNVPCEEPVKATLETALAVLATLDLRRGFMGVVLDDRCCLQLLRERNGVRVELLDSSLPAAEVCLADSRFAEALLRAAAGGQDVFAVAKAGGRPWTRQLLA